MRSCTPGGYATASIAISPPEPSLYSPRLGRGAQNTTRRPAKAKRRPPQSGHCGPTAPLRSAPARPAPPPPGARLHGNARLRSPRPAGPGPEAAGAGASGRRGSRAVLRRPPTAKRPRLRSRRFAPVARAGAEARGGRGAGEERGPPGGSRAGPLLGGPGREGKAGPAGGACARRTKAGVGAGALLARGVHLRCHPPLPHGFVLVEAPRRRAGPSGTCSSRGCWGGRAGAAGTCSSRAAGGSAELGVSRGTGPGSSRGRGRQEGRRARHPEPPNPGTACPPAPRSFSCCGF